MAAHKSLFCMAAECKIRFMDGDVTAAGAA